MKHKNSTASTHTSLSFASAHAHAQHHPLRGLLMFVPVPVCARPAQVFGISSSHILISLACLAAPSIMVAVTDLAGRVWARNVMDVEEPAPLLTLGYG